MTVDQFIKALRDMVGLPPLAMERLISLAPKMTDAERQEAATDIGAIHSDIVATQEGMLKEMDAGERDIRDAKREMREQESADAEHIFDDIEDDSPSAL